MALTKEVWIHQLKENFYPNSIFLNKVLDFSSEVNNNKIHIASAGIDPKVLINNKTYPINVVGRTDEDCEISLYKFETENTIVRRPEAIEYGYDKLESVLRQHRATLQKAVAMMAAHAIAPNEDTTLTPIVGTSGSAKDGRKRLTFSDILDLKERFDEAEIPLDKRYLILHPKHVSDLLAEDLNLFKELTNISDGEPTKFAGFGCFSFPNMPTYNISSGKYVKVPYTEENTANFASVAFYADEIMKADGDVYMYSKEDDPTERATIVGFDKRFICMPIRNRGIGAIVSTNS